MLAPRKKLWSTPKSALVGISNLLKTSSAVLMKLERESSSDNNNNNNNTECQGLTKKDVVYDIGCGNANILIDLAQEFTDCKNFIGIEINPERAKEAEQRVKEAKSSGNISEDTIIKIICKNALDTGNNNDNTTRITSDDDDDVEKESEDSLAVSDYSDATVIFLYLIPRGLRLIKPILMQSIKGEHKVLRVITYMSKFHDEEYVAKDFCTGSNSPIYLYHFSSTKEEEKEEIK